MKYLKYNTLSGVLAFMMVMTTPFTAVIASKTSDGLPCKSHGHCKSCNCHSGTCTKGEKIGSPQDGTYKYYNWCGHRSGTCLKGGEIPGGAKKCCGVKVEVVHRNGPIIVNKTYKCSDYNYK